MEANSVDPVLGLFQSEPHRAYTTEDVVNKLDNRAVKDPEKFSAALGVATSKLNKLIESGEISEIDAGLFKARLFFDDQKWIEHAYTGGFGNTHYAFHASIFRLNLGVLSVFFIKHKKTGKWDVTIHNTTRGEKTVLEPLSDGSYTFGSREAKEGENNYRQVEGAYIEPEHVVVTIDGDKMSIEDLKTLNGTRVDLLTEAGLSQYLKAAKDYLAQTGSSNQDNPVKRGRYIMDQLMNNHVNYESSFFGAVVESM
jgi:hypothetical protein